ncbi:hypothetical protein AN639_04620 [Candidatus Epulonipiscium fishelsonii]|uniref:Uncharacterized protein n=1 Tax=Candidatus Epulonipiscium fishelsonii TaxID=77094 RepID=A0ACC8XEA2_9FIRM|nr:hypothetical protein AN639_04620 [Epulopiscium sp. SCG-B05WGA-EpuloA1]ONI41519.1 hypothetical protein AN396_03485 [Epulopiscium sp. SCG-B11WGA-EpuloA1]
MKKILFSFVAIVMIICSLSSMTFANSPEQQQQQQQQDTTQGYTVTREGSVITIKDKAGSLVCNVEVTVFGTIEEKMEKLASGSTDANGSFDFGPYEAATELSIELNKETLMEYNIVEDSFKVETVKKKTRGSIVNPYYFAGGCAIVLSIWTMTLIIRENIFKKKRLEAREENAESRKNKKSE